MTAVPANFYIDMTFQDTQGFRSQARIAFFEVDLSGATAALVSDMYAYSAAVTAAVAAASNAKLVRQNTSFDWGYAQEPTTETGMYELVTQKAHLDGGDGNGGFMKLEIPAPKDALFLAPSTPSQDKNVVVNPGSSLLTAIQSALANSSLTWSPSTARGGKPFSQFFGGQLIQAKARRRRVLQGA